MSIKKAFILTFSFVLVLGVSRGPVDTADSIQNSVPVHLETDNFNSKIQNHKASESNENERKNSEKDKVYEEQTKKKGSDKVIESPSTYFYSRRLPTKPIEKIVIENPPHLSVQAKNLDIAKRFRRSPTVIRILHLNYYNEEESIERFKRHLPQVDVDPKILERFERDTDKRHKGHLQKFPVQYEDEEKILQLSKEYKVIHKTRERSKRYPQILVLKSDLDETSKKGEVLGPRKSNERTAEPYDSSEEEPTRNNKADDSSKMAIPFNEPTRPVRPMNRLKPGRHNILEAPVNNKPIDYELVKPTAATGSLRGLGLPPTIPMVPYSAHQNNCVHCTNKYHNHGPYSRSGYGQIGHYYGQSHQRYGSVEMYPGSVHSYYPARNVYVNRHFEVLQHPSQIEGRGVVKYSSNDGNDYPLAEF